MIKIEQAARIVAEMEDLLGRSFDAAFGTGFAGSADVETPWALGDWEFTPPRLAARLSEAGVKMLSSDDYAQCVDCELPIRLLPVEDLTVGELVTLPGYGPICLDEMGTTHSLDSIIEALGAENNPNVALWFRGADDLLFEDGWSRYNVSSFRTGMPMKELSASAGEVMGIVSGDHPRARLVRTIDRLLPNGSHEWTLYIKHPEEDAFEEG